MKRRNVLVTNITPKKWQIQRCPVRWELPASVRCVALGMDAFIHIPWQIFKKAKRECSLSLLKLKLNYSRQKNVDFSVSNALNYRMKGIEKAIFYYDIMCQYWTNLKKRFAGNPYLNLPTWLHICRAIGLFHVHGHKDSCFPRFAPTYIPGAGQVDGEIIETLWSSLNLIAHFARRMSKAHRGETMDDHMADSNWKKLLGIGKTKFAW